MRAHYHRSSLVAMRFLIIDMTALILSASRSITQARRRIYKRYIISVPWTARYERERMNDCQRISSRCLYSFFTRTLNEFFRGRETEEQNVGSMKSIWIIFGRVSNVRNAGGQNNYVARWRLLWMVARTLSLSHVDPSHSNKHDLCMNVSDHG